MARFKKLPLYADKITALHSKGYSNRKIAIELDLCRSDIHLLIRELGLVSNGIPKQIKLLDGNNAECSKCKRVKELEEFPKQRGKYLTYCQKCRSEQINQNINSNKEKFLKAYYHGLVNRCKYRKVKFDLSFEYFLEEYNKHNEKCFYTDVIFTLRNAGKSGKGKREKMSIDKIFPDLGYTVGNIVFCTVHANTMKNDCTLEEIKKWLPTFYERIVNKLNSNKDDTIL